MPKVNFHTKQSFMQLKIKCRLDLDRTVHLIAELNQGSLKIFLLFIVIYQHRFTFKLLVHCEENVESREICKKRENRLLVSLEYRLNRLQNTQTKKSCLLVYNYCCLGKIHTMNLSFLFTEWKVKHPFVPLSCVALQHIVPNDSHLRGRALHSLLEV